MGKIKKVKYKMAVFLIAIMFVTGVLAGGPISEEPEFEVKAIEGVNVEDLPTSDKVTKLFNIDFSSATEGVPPERGKVKSATGSYSVPLGAIMEKPSDILYVSDFVAEESERQLAPEAVGSAESEDFSGRVEFKEKGFLGRMVDRIVDWFIGGNG